MKKICTVVALITVGLAYSQVKDIVISEDLKANAQVLPIRGNGFISLRNTFDFGKYHTTFKQRNFTSSQTITLLGVPKVNKRNPISFTIVTPDGLSADVEATNQYNVNPWKLGKGLEEFLKDFQNGMTGIIIPKNKNNKSWIFKIHNSGSTEATKEQVNFGIASDGAGNTVDIIGTKETENTPILADFSKTFGYELRKNGKSIAAVSVIGNGNVWMRNDISSEDKLIASSLISALLSLRNLQSK